MRAILRFPIVAAVVLGLVLPLGGCNSDSNEASMAGTKGVAAPNAPKSQAEFYKQQKALEKPAKGTAPAAK
jgi:hypothetical protein